MKKDYSYSSYRDGNFVTVPPIGELCLALKDKFIRQEEECERLREENKKLKEGIWEKEEVAKLKMKYEEMKEDYFRGFPISKEEMSAIRKWEEKYKGMNLGAIGGGFTYKFTPTSIGVSGVVIGPDGDKFEFQELG